ncbi:hypothetical protein [Catellatospora tritici]|uniref:hypothetical protein n=1 Tax=Catellatospora tritici TaxID=2851566 RepID=UPI001C2D1A41|nr:hypothetical protein [Catellatospora tritici]MBV1853078.1 hypothetical protein [Catellatospora tritici]
MAGLSTQELTQIEETLAAGKRPRVMFTEAAGQIAGQLGQVVQLDDPAVHDEWIMVKFGSDVLPFAPSDLTIPPKGATGKKPAPEPVVEEPAAPEPEFMVIRQKPVRQERPVSQSPEVSEAEATAAAPAPRRAAAGKGPKVKPPAGLTVTLAYTEGEWTVGAVQGTKALAKPYVIKAQEALKMVSMLDVPGVQEAVEQILASERAEAQAHAEKLRAELAELEAKLAELG